MAEKKDEDLFVISKKAIIQVDEEDTQTAVEKLNKKSKRSLEDKLGHLGCYRYLKPDVISAPAHIVSVKKPSNTDSKRQKKLEKYSQVGKVRVEAKTVKHKKQGVKTPLLVRTTEKFDSSFKTDPASLDAWNGNFLAFTNNKNIF